jgi:carbon storage regulator
MLVLSRKAGERITIGDEITLIVLDASNSRVRIGIEAPRSVCVKRSELDHLPEESRAAANTA